LDGNFDESFCAYEKVLLHLRIEIVLKIPGTLPYILFRPPIGNDPLQTQDI
jgi:hypothetical protein